MRIQQFNFDLDLLQVIPWEKDSAPNLAALLGHKAEWYKKYYSEFWSDWERDVFNLETANDFGLNVWAIILDLPLYTNPEESPPNFPAFGFASFGRPFDQGYFATSGNLANTLTLEQRRMLLTLRWMCLVSDGSMHSINRDVFRVFKGTLYCLDRLDMTISYIFTQDPSDLIVSLMKTYDLLPRPAGVKANILIKPRDAFGFDPYGVPFDQEFSQFWRI